VELSLGSQGRLILSPPEAKDIPEIPLRPLKVSEVEIGMPSLEIAARVRRKLQPKEFKRADGSSGKVISLVIADDTWTIRTSFWDAAVDLVQKVQPGDIILLKNAYSRAGLGGAVEIHVGGSGAVEVNPKGVSVAELGPTSVKLEKLEPNMDCLDLVGRVLEVSTPREFTRPDGSRGAVSSVQISDGTAAVRVSLWNEHAARAGEIKAGDVVRLVDAYSSLGQFGSVEVHLGKMGRIEVNPSGVEQPPADVQRAPTPPAPRKSVAELEKEGERAEVRGTLVQVFHRRPIFDVCPSCGKSVGGADTSLTCEGCGKTVTPEHRVVISFLLDDGTGNIRVALFGKVAEKFLGMSTQQIFQMFKNTPDIGRFYDELKLLGREILVTGVTRQDKYFDQLELRVYEVRVPDPQEEAWAQLQKTRGESG
jgi:replication factor A1